MRGLAEKTISISEWRDLCRAIGYRYSAIHLHVSPEQWKLVRDVLVCSVVIASQTLAFEIFKLILKKIIENRVIQSYH